MIIIIINFERILLLSWFPWWRLYWWYDKEHIDVDDDDDNKMAQSAKI